MTGQAEATVQETFQSQNVAAVTLPLESVLGKRLCMKPALCHWKLETPSQLCTHAAESQMVFHMDPMIQ